MGKRRHMVGRGGGGAGVKGHDGDEGLGLGSRVGETMRGSQVRMGFRMRALTVAAAGTG